MDKDILKTIKIINEILGLLQRHLGHCAGDVMDRTYIQTKRQDLYKIINNNKEE